MSGYYWDIIKAFMDELRGNPRIALKNLTTPLPLSKKSKQKVQADNPDGIFDFHGEMDGLAIEWQGKRIKTADVKGSINILPSQEVLKDWKGIVYFDFTPGDGRIKHFHPIDFFIDEACAGAFLGEPGKLDPSLYLFNFEGEPVNLRMDMQAYVRMAVAAKGFLYWQYAILDILEGRENPASQRFKEWMPKLFEGFSWEQYVQLYAHARIP